VCWFVGFFFFDGAVEGAAWGGGVDRISFSPPPLPSPSLPPSFFFFSSMKPTNGGTGKKGEGSQLRKKKGKSGVLRSLSSLNYTPVLSFYSLFR